MRIKLQDRRPYQDAIRWQIHRDYFQSKGADAFLDKEVPFNVTSNQVAATQNAQMVLTALAQQNLSDTEPIRILELASGLGVFALNFLKAFETLCRAQKLNYFERLEYWLTDFSIKTLEQLEHKTFFQERIQQGKLKLFHFDAIEGQVLSDLTGHQIQLSDYRFSAYIANYHHCTLPMAMILYKQGRFMQLEVESYAWLTGSPTEPSSFENRQHVLKQIAAHLSNCQLPTSLPEQLQSCLRQSMQQVIELIVQDPVAQNWSPELDLKACLVRWLFEAFQSQAQMLQAKVDEKKLQELILQVIVEPLFEKEHFSQEQLQEIHHGQDIDPENYCHHLTHALILRELVKELDEATLAYPFSSLQSFEKLMPCLHDQGIYLISDKAYTEVLYFQGLRQDLPSIHGDSIAHMVNYPFFEKWFSSQGYSSCVMQDKMASLHVLMTVKAAHVPLTLANEFDHVFVQENQNMNTQLLLEAGRKLYNHGEFQLATRLFLKAYQYRPADGVLLMNLAACYLSQKSSKEALWYLEQEHDAYFQLELFASWRAEAYRAMGNHQKALENYLLGLEQFGKNALYQLNLAKCYSHLGQIDQALNHLQIAQSIAPENEDVLGLMETLLYQTQV